MEHMLHHVAAVARAHPRGLLIADMPYRSYEEPEEAVRNARRLVEAGAQCLKIEGGRAVLPQVEAVLAAGIPVHAEHEVFPLAEANQVLQRLKQSEIRASAVLAIP